MTIKVSLTLLDDLHFDAGRLVTAARLWRHNHDGLDDEAGSGFTRRRSYCRRSRGHCRGGTKDGAHAMVKKAVVFIERAFF